MKSVVPEDRSRNVVIFGLPERKDESVEERVQGVIQEIGLKLTLQANRLDKICKQNLKRLAKVSLSTMFFGKSKSSGTLQHSARYT